MNSINPVPPDPPLGPPPAEGEAAPTTAGAGDGDAPKGKRGRPHGRITFAQDFQRFFVRGLATLMPTLITLWLLLKIWNFLWLDLGQYLLEGTRRLMGWLAENGVLPLQNYEHLRLVWRSLPEFTQHVVGVFLAIVVFYFVGFFVGNILGKITWRLMEMAVLRVPLIRAIYPAVKQVTDFLLAEKKHQFESGRVVAVEPHAKGIWSIGLVTGGGIQAISGVTRQDMITVFVPSSPTAFSGYVLVVPRESVIELPLSVEQAMRLLVSGGVIDPSSTPEPEKLTGLFKDHARELAARP